MTANDKRYRQSFGYFGATFYDFLRINRLYKCFSKTFDFIVIQLTIRQMLEHLGSWRMQERRCGGCERLQQMRVPRRLRW